MAWSSSHMFGLFDESSEHQMEIKSENVDWEDGEREDDVHVQNNDEEEDSSEEVGDSEPVSRADEGDCVEDVESMVINIDPFPMENDVQGGCLRKIKPFLLSRSECTYKFFYAFSFNMPLVPLTCPMPHTLVTRR